MTLQEMMQKIEKHLQQEEGGFGCSFGPEMGWVASMEWGKEEASDSDMAAAAAYFLGDSLEGAIEGLLKDAGLV